MVFFIPGIRELWARDEDDVPPEASPPTRKARRARKGGARVGSAPRTGVDEERAADAVSEAEPCSDEDEADAPRARSVRTYAREAAALVLMASGLYCALALASYEADPMRASVAGENWVGPVGEVLAGGSCGGDG